MKDRHWQAVFDALSPLLAAADMVVAPRGDWPAFPCECRFYDDRIAIDDATVLVLHKGRFAALEKSELRRIAERWQWIFANDVFIVLSRSPKRGIDVRHGRASVHCRPLASFLGSASLRKRDSRLIYVHAPKTGGSSMWAWLIRAFPSHVYYPSLSAFLANPPARRDYDLIGLHFSPSVLAGDLSADDRVIGMVREPTERFLSAVLHSRRDSEDPATFGASMKAMRELDTTQFLATGFARHETRLQLITFGGDHRRPIDAVSDEALLAAALAFAGRANVVLAPSERSVAFAAFLARRLGLRLREMRRFNASEPTLREAHRAEFDAARPRIEATNAYERAFYDFVCRSFAEREAG